VQAETQGVSCAGAAIQVRDLHVAYGGTPVLHGVNLDFAPGTFTALLGSSGCGKTTLLRSLCGFVPVRSGSIVVGDRDVTLTPPENRGMAMVFQSYALWPHKTVHDNVAYALKLRRVPSADIESRVKQALTQLSLAHLAERFPHQLSGGQQQRVALARALVYNPPVILLDEPLSNLDAKLREEARAWLRELIVKMQLSALCVTHDQSEALAMSDRILLLNNGVIEQQGTPQQMYSEPETLFTADFMGSNNRLSGRIAEISNGAALLEGTGWRLWGTAKPSAKQGGEGTGLIRLERIRVASAQGENCLEAKLATSMYLGDKWEHLFELGANRLRAYGDRPLAEGRHWLALPREELWIF